MMSLKHPVVPEIKEAIEVLSLWDTSKGQRDQHKEAATGRKSNNLSSIKVKEV